MKVGSDLASDDRRAALIRRELGPEGILMMDANQVWGVDEAIVAMRTLRAHDPWWIEEPTSPDDILGHARIRREIAPVRVATGGTIQNRVVFKQLFQAEAIDVCQLDACRVGGVNEAVAVQLLAAKFGIPVCPHAGGVGLCEYVQHLAFFDYISVSGSLENRVVEWVDHLHEHFPGSCGRARRTVCGADRSRIRHRDAARVTGRVRISRRAGVGRRRPLGGRGLMHTVTEPKQIEAGARTSRDRYGFLGRGEERRHRRRARHEGQRGEVR